MLSLIDVRCPHCHAEGRIVTPPPGAIIVGPCPECSEMVVVFGGKVLALDKEIITNGTADAKKEHLLEVIGVYIQHKIDALFNRSESLEEDEDAGTLGESSAPPPEMLSEFTGDAIISNEEMSAFLTNELRLIDDPDYFKAIFE